MYQFLPLDAPFQTVRRPQGAIWADYLFKSLDASVEGLVKSPTVEKLLGTEICISAIISAILDLKNVPDKDKEEAIRYAQHVEYAVLDKYGYLYPESPQALKEARDYWERQEGKRRNPLAS